MIIRINSFELDIGLRHVWLSIPFVGELHVLNDPNAVSLGLGWHRDTACHLWFRRWRAVWSSLAPASRGA